MAARKHNATKNQFREISDDFVWKLNRCLQHYLMQEFPDHQEFAEGRAEPALAGVFYLNEHLLAKYNDPRGAVSNEERRTAAIVKWLGVERRNQRTNVRIDTTNPRFKLLSRTRTVDSSLPLVTTAWDIVFRARSLIRRILGNCPTGDELSTFLIEGGGFTGGASTSKKRSLDNLARKFTEQMDATPSLLRLIHMSEFRRVHEGWSEISGVDQQWPRLVKGNILFTVPKNAEIDRVACKEPDLNLYCQKAVGNHIRRQLRRHGIDLNDQGRNQYLASEAYKKGYATIDLSSASDSLAKGLVRALLPPHWNDLLMALRSPKTFIDGGSHENEMISSMGNGFTFELESLIFYSLARAVQEETDEVTGNVKTDVVVGVFGDDLIINQRYAKTLIAVLGWAGFRVNASKSFITGPLFESCGKHYYCGLDVSPFYIRKPFSDVSDLILALNQLRNWMQRVGIDLYETVEKPLYSFYEIWKEFIALVPRSLHGGWDLEVRTSLVTLGASRCKLVPEMRPVKQVVEDYLKGMYLARLAGTHEPTGPDMHGLEHLDDPSLKFTETYPSRWTGKWMIRRYVNHARFFGICTSPLYQEMAMSYGPFRRVN